MKQFRSLAWALISVLLFAPAAIAILAEDCPPIVRTALEATSQLCEVTGRNQACYGHVRLQAQPQPGIDNFAFNEAGDVVDVTEMQSLRLWPLEPQTGIWGVALMRLQADIPTSDNANVTLLTFGDVQIQNAVQEPTQLPATVAVNTYINVRRGPSTQAGPVGALAPGQTVNALERLADNSWLRVELPDSGVTGWVSAPLLTVTGDVDTLNVAERWSPHYRAMQAFYFESGNDAPPCGTTPTSGMLIQTPEGVGEVTLLINEVNIRIGSTVFFQSQPGVEMTITTVEGHASVTANGVTHTAAAGSRIHVPLNENNEPAGSPSRPEPYLMPEVEDLPISALDRPITIAEPLTEEQIAQIDQPPADAVCDCANAGNGGCPGQSCNAPGHGGSCPGQSCNAPGHGGDCPGGSCDNPGGDNSNSGRGRGN